MRLILVRHGQTRSNVDRLLDTEPPGADLTDLGREQADALPTALADEAVDAVWSSDLDRARRTAAPLAAKLGLTVQTRPGVREIRAGEFEMRNDDESVQVYLDTVRRWMEGEQELRMPGAETGAEVLARYDAVVAELEGTGVGTAVVVSHGAVIRCWAGSRAGNAGVLEVATIPLGNTGVVIMDGGSAGGWTAVSWDGHAVGPDHAPTPDEGPTARPLE